MDWVGAPHPVVKVEGTIRTCDEAGWAKVFTPADECDLFCCVVGTDAGEREVFNTVIAPGRDEHAAAEFDDGAGAFAGRVDHPERSAQFAIPSNERVNRFAAVDPLEAVVGAFVDAE